MATVRFPIGTKLYAGDGELSTSPTYTEVPEVTSIGVPVGYSVDEEETTSHGSSGTSKVRRFSPTLADRGEIPFEVLLDWEDATHRNLMTASWGRTSRAWKIELPIQTAGNTTHETYEVDGFIKSLPSPTADAQNHIRSSGSIRIGSDFTRTAEAA